MSDATSPAPLRLAPTMFREYDLRGRVPEIFPDAADELSDEGMRTLGKAFGTLMKERERQRVVVAHDLRTYSPRLAACFLEGLVTTGVDVTDIGLGLSPTLYFATLHLDCPAGVMITASHNPQGWSGLKMSLDYVQTMLRPDIELPGAIRWTRRRLQRVHAGLVVVRALLAPELAIATATVTALRARLGVAPVLPVLRERVAAALTAVPAPLGLRPRLLAGGEHRRHAQQPMGPDPPPGPA